ncbi:hypothetical protein KSP40_PGU010716 [Platanthera guangdongensis]|uniref:Uncharacterized protein n=1 Tax=Platanthera guangdongensis TaxID=2320717 RepID=A0ABR2MW63_9ASPA
MASFVLGKTKRKGFDDVYDDFSALSLSAPAPKARRLDAELPSVMEMGQRVGDPVANHKHSAGFMCDAMADSLHITKKPIVKEELALVLYTPLHHQFSPTFKMDPELLSGLKKPVRLHRNLSQPEESLVEEQQSSTANCLAVVPWVSTISDPSTQVSSVSGAVEEDVMDAAEYGESMEIEGELGQIVGASVGSLPQWQQHCMNPALSQVPSTPILGSW